VDHTILQYALPLVLNPSNLKMENQKEYLTASRGSNYLVIGAKNDVAHAWTVIGVLLAFRV
jgi:hypothetical protein